MDPSPTPELLASMAPEDLRTHMRKLGYKTQADLAAAIGVSRSAVSLWLEGKVGVKAGRDAAQNAGRGAEAGVLKRALSSSTDLPSGNHRP